MITDEKKQWVLDQLTQGDVVVARYARRNIDLHRALAAYAALAAAHFAGRSDDLPLAGAGGAWGDGDELPEHAAGCVVFVMHHELPLLNWLSAV